MEVEVVIAQAQAEVECLERKELCPRKRKMMSGVQGEVDPGSSTRAS